MEGKAKKHDGMESRKKKQPNGWNVYKPPRTVSLAVFVFIRRRRHVTTFQRLDRERTAGANIFMNFSFCFMFFLFMERVGGRERFIGFWAVENCARTNWNWIGDWRVAVMKMWTHAVLILRVTKPRAIEFAGTFTTLRTWNRIKQNSAKSRVVCQIHQRREIMLQLETI